MADPLSIASGSLAVITATKQTVTVIYKFIRDCKEARADLSQIRGELSELTLILELIKDEDASSTKDCLPSALQSQVQSMLTSCTSSAQEIEKTLAKCRGKSGPLLWGLAEKEKVAGLKIQLEAFKSGLSLALETINLSVTREIRHTTETVRDNTVEIKRDTSEILNEIYKLRNQLPPGLPLGPDQLRLDQWLDNLTHYAETVVADQASDGMSDTDSILKHAEEQGGSDNPPDTSKQPRLSTAGQKFETTFTDEGSAKSASSLQGFFRKLFRENNKPAVSDPGQNNNELLISSSPCNSNIVNYDYCETIETWATLHEDHVLRFWSSRTGNLRASLPVFRDDDDESYLDRHGMISNASNTNVKFCNAKPDLILIEAPGRVEVWDWGSGVRVPIARNMFDQSGNSWTKFIPRSTIIYKHTSSEVRVVHTSAPSNVQTFSLQAIMKGPYDSLKSRGYELWEARFVSEDEIIVLWLRAVSSSDSSSRVKNSPQYTWKLKGYLVVLPSTVTSKSTSHVGIQYSDTVVRNSMVTEPYVIPGDFKSINQVSADATNRMLTVSGTLASHQEDLNKKDGREECWKTFFLNLDTGATLYQFDAAWCHIVHPHKYAIMDSPAEHSIIARNLEDERELGRTPRQWWWKPSVSGTVTRMRLRNGKMEFSSWTVPLVAPRTPQRTR
ncbi:hypothetical protein F5Y08DRAFT_258202 [Xylaria arbuscula]|nr:hypothetical protein F5Y08DRAFT_258202 [Xylaria arbuscula]